MPFCRRRGSCFLRARMKAVVALQQTIICPRFWASMAQRLRSSSMREIVSVESIEQPMVPKGREIFSAAAAATLFRVALSSMK
jgi:hypothetical protein